MDEISLNPEKVLESEIENNPFAVFPKTLLEKALEAIEEFTEEISPK